MGWAFGDFAVLRWGSQRYLEGQSRSKNNLLLGLACPQSNSLGGTLKKSISFYSFKKCKITAGAQLWKRQLTLLCPFLPLFCFKHCLTNTSFFQYAWNKKQFSYIYPNNNYIRKSLRSVDQFEINIEKSFLARAPPHSKGIHSFTCRRKRRVTFFYKVFQLLGVLFWRGGEKFGDTKHVGGHVTGRRYVAAALASPVTF